MNPDADTNPFGHACIILSRQMTPEKKVEVIDCLGFYGITPSNDNNPFIKKIKRALGMDINFTGGYGILRREELRYLDRGVGLDGKTFHISEEQFNEFVTSCKHDIAEQDAAIGEAYDALLKEGVKPFKEKGKDKFFSVDVYKKELELAKKEGREPRLKPFELRLEFNDDGLPSLRNASTCKTRAVDLLDEAGVDKEQINDLGKGHSKGVVPRYSGQKGPLALHAIGPMEIFTSSRTKVTHFNHTWDPNFDYQTDRYQAAISKPDNLKHRWNKKYNALRTKIYWTIPPQHVIPTESTTDEETALIRNDYNIFPMLLNKVQSLMAKVQRIERLLMFSSDANCDIQSKVEILHKLHIFSRFAFSYAHKNADQSYVKAKIDEVNLFLEQIDAALKTDDIYERGCFEMNSAFSGESVVCSLQLTAKERGKCIKIMDFPNLLALDEYDQDYSLMRL